MPAKRTLIILCLFLCSAFLLFSQDTEEVEEARRLLVYFEVQPGAELSEREQVLLHETLLIELSEASKRIAVKEFDKRNIPPSETEKTDTAKQLQADSWLYVAVSGSTDALLIEVQSLDMLSGQIVYSAKLDKEISRGIRDLQRRFWGEVASALAAAYEESFSRNITGGTLVFEGLPGTRIRGPAWQKLRIGEDGLASAKVPLPATLPYRATKPGYFPLEGQIYMDQTRKVFTLEQKQGSRFAFDIFLSNMSYPGFDVTYYFIPDVVFCRVGLLTYLVGIVLDEDGWDGNSMFVSHSLNNFSLGFGYYFSAPDRYLRSYFVATAVWRIITAEGFWGQEPIAPFALQPVLGVEYGRSPKFKAYVEYAPYFYWAPDRFFFALSLPLDRDVRFLFLPREEWARPPEWAWVWEIFVFQVGMRVQL